MLDFLGLVVFAIFTIMIVGAGLGVVLANRVTTSALLMAFTFLNMAGMFVLLGAETIAAFQVLIYVGAITVLILYGVMFTPQTPRAYGLFFQKQTPWGAVLAALAALPVIVVAFSFHDAKTVAPPGGDLNALAIAVFNSFAFPFEVASVLLLAAMVGAIVLVKRESPAAPPAAPLRRSEPPR
ncbi:MAG: NADH-quinone oxidoreductase subunit J [Chloroflexota bacterium]|nr:NADH-quinone oxidoreductase subunit J [Chloroflexota bacterium]MDE3193461.1 NADH-quinone oxidoreductase subunit J [Chloroflexota bacterium]